MKKLCSLLISVCAALVLLTGTAAAGGQTLMMATTTSTDNTGLLDYLIPHFERETGILLKWTATGTGNALKLGQNCDVDVLLVHAPAAEKAFIEKGYGLDRKQIMYNDFVVIGPQGDPASIKGLEIPAALERMKDKKAVFVSRGDDSGTHKKELLLWKAAGLDVPDGESWYIQAGQGMLATINMAQEQRGYTMTDRGTYIKYQAGADKEALLEILVEGDEILMNQYSVVTLDPKNCPDVKHDLAKRYLNWMAGEKAQQLIRDFRIGGQVLFVPNAR